jgi:hypothetical protein
LVAVVDSSGRSAGQGRFASLHAMRKVIGFLGFFLALAGISGTIDHLFYQPILGAVLNSFNRWVVPSVDFLADRAVFANLTLAALGAVMAIAAYRAQD